MTAPGTIRWQRHTARQRQNRGNPVRYDSNVGYDGTILAECIRRGLLKEHEVADRQKRNDALTKLLFALVHDPPPTHCPRCGHRI